MSGDRIIDAQDKRKDKFAGHIGRITKEAIEESLAEIANAFDALIADRDEWKQQHENLLAVRKQDIEALSLKIQRKVE